MSLSQSNGLQILISQKEQAIVNYIDVCAAVIRRGNMFLLARRLPNSHLAGKWEFPGGKLEQNEDISSSLQNEVFQETGLKCQIITRIACVESRILETGSYQGSTYVGLTGIVKTDNCKVSLSNEHDDFRWVSIDKPWGSNLTPETLHAIKVLSKKLSDLMARP